VEGGLVEVRDNLPFRPGSAKFDGDMTLSGFMEELNSRVFLWPGSADGPIATGRKHLQHYSELGGVRILRFSLQELIRANPDRTLEVTFCNSGSARHQKGLPVSRGRHTFQSVPPLAGAPSDVKEITFIGHASLPTSTVWAESLAGPWRPLGDS
jgi:hypothetical protein